MIQLDQLPTEQRNPKTACIDRLSTLEMVRRINDEDKKVAYAVEKELDNIAEAVDAIYAALKDGSYTAAAAPLAGLAYSTPSNVRPPSQQIRKWCRASLLAENRRSSAPLRVRRTICRPVKRT